MSASEPVLAAVNSLRTTLGQRQWQTLGCNYKTKTVREISELIVEANTILRLVQGGMYSQALEFVHQLCSVDFRIAGRVLKGADTNISTCDEFVATVENTLARLAESLQALIKVNAPVSGGHFHQ